MAKVEIVKRFDDLTDQEILKLSTEDLTLWAKKEAAILGIKFVDEPVKEPELGKLETTPCEPIYELKANIKVKDRQALDDIVVYATDRLKGVKAYGVEIMGNWGDEFRPVIVKEDNSGYHKTIEVEEYTDVKNNMTAEQYRAQRGIIDEYNKSFEDSKKAVSSLEEFDKILSNLFDRRYRIQKADDELTRKAQIFGQYMAVENDLAKAKQYYQVAYECDNEEIIKIVERYNLIITKQ